ncbi:hypothetical protein [Enterobacter asburiae]|uniref:Uncharacterized protein n=1 Tax=Enterobacter asburiae TaxID=61645 RepID=A0AB36FBZ5_ENTAS|nr:hypothetical protein [Enterobacter asburiae]CZY46149.1 Uncharacterised protein [Enterobacter cloacae]KVJ09520.1 hypothetical protein AWS40_23690 [Enterobacter asburiae]MCK1017613.1 hypothetical protein [Enterobacter asburiae]MDU2342935.1 hypothetical protein [Enterobacter asburiae]MEC5860665.1 hypothetical protein [Enterobacter asburiae]
MSTLTKEWLLKTIAELEEERDAVPGVVNEDAANALAAMKLALASLEAEPVAWLYSASFERGHVEGELTDAPGCDMPVYTSPPAPVSVPTFDEWLEIRGNKPLGWVKDAMRESYDACRAAMLQGAEPDFREISNSSTNNFRENAETSTKCWCHTCRPVKISDMRFVVCPECGNKRCPHANDHRHACTGSNEPGQNGSAYPAAPQQEVKA